jgi:hypothetical protein
MREREEKRAREAEGAKEHCEDDPSCQETWHVDKWQERDEKCCRTCKYKYSDQYRDTFAALYACPKGTIFSTASGDTVIPGRNDETCCEPEPSGETSIAGTFSNPDAPVENDVEQEAPEPWQSLPSGAVAAVASVACLLALLGVAVWRALRRGKTETSPAHGAAAAPCGFTALGGKEQVQPRTIGLWPV